MIGNKLEQSIISVFQSNLSSTYSINELAKILGKSYPNINKKSNFFLKEGVLQKIVKGSSYQCFLNVSNDKAKIFMAVNEINKQESLFKSEPRLQRMNSIISNASYRSILLTAIVFGNTIYYIFADENSKRDNKKQAAISGIKQEFSTIEEFQTVYLENPDMQRNHIVLFNVQGFVNILSALKERVLAKAIVEKIFP